MPNWKKVIVSGSDASLNSLLVASSLTIGSSSLGSTENTLVVGLPPAGGTGEGGQILLQASGGLYTTASMIDNYQNKLRFLRGTNAGSDAYKLQLDMHTGQVQLPNYNSVTALTGSIVGFLAFDNAGNILTSTGSGGGGGGTFPYTGVASINGGLIVTGSITASGAIHAQANGAMYFRGGDDAELWDINVTNTVGIYGQQDQGVASIKLGSGGGTISGRSGSIGIGTINPTSASLTVNGNIWATSLTGSLLGTASFATSASFASNAGSSSYALNAGNSISSSFATNAGSASYALNAGNAQSSSFASTASSADNFTVRGTLTAQTIVVQVITSSTEFVTGSTKNGTLASNTHQFTGSVSISGSLTVQGAISGSNITGSLLGTASYASNALSSSYAVNSGNTISASFSTNAGSASYALNAGNSISSSFATNAGSASYALNAGSAQSASFATNAANAATASYITSSNVRGPFGFNSILSASYASGSTTSSYAINSGNTISASFATSASQAVSSSWAYNADLLDGVHLSILATTGSNTFRGDQTITGSVILSGSSGVELTVRGDQVNTGSLTVAGAISASSFTGSLLGTASFATNAISASFFSGAVTSASYASASTSASFATNAQTASFFSGTVTSASYAATASFATNGNSSFLHTQSSAATTWSVVHNFQTQFPVVTVYDNTNSVIIPQQISASTTSSLTILFSSPRTGYVAVSKGGYTANVGTASFAFTSSLAILALTASFLSGSVSTANSASYAATSSYSEGFKISQAQYFATSSAISGSSRIIVLSTSSFNAVFVDYVLSSGSNQRAGTVVGTWNSSNIRYMDNSTLDIGTTSVVTMSVAISASSAVVQTQSPAGWTIKTTYRTI